MKNSFDFPKKACLNQKILIYYKAKLNTHSQNKANNLFSNYSEISSIMKLKTSIDKKFYFIYLNRVNINDILYKEEELIKVNISEEKQNLTLYFYFDLLIDENKHKIINYIYSFEIIDNINKYQNSVDQKLIYKKILLAKIIRDLIYNHQSFDGNDGSDEKELNNIENINKNIIVNNIKNIKESIGHWNLEYFEENNIDKIYIDIIKALFQEKSMKNKDNVLQILEQIELESIDINEQMMEKFSQIFDINNNFIKEYMINDINDLMNIEKIEFYFIIFKYIFKESIYLYQIPFLLKTRKNIINLINNKLGELSFININGEYQSKLEFILKKITDSKFYYNKYIDDVWLKLKNILEYYKKYLSESKSEDIIIIENEIKNKNKDINVVSKYLKDYEKAIKMNERFNIIYFLFEQKTKNEPFSDKALDKYANEWEILENKINEEKIEEISENDINILIGFLKSPENKELFIKIFNKSIYKQILNNKKYKIEICDSNETKKNSKELENNELEVKEQTNPNKNSLLCNKNQENRIIKIIDVKSDSNSSYDSSESIKSCSYEPQEESNIEEIEIQNQVSISKRRYPIKDDEKLTNKTNKKDNNADNKFFDYSTLICLGIISQVKNSTSEIIKEINDQIIISCGFFHMIFYSNESNYPIKLEKNEFNWINNIEEFGHKKESKALISSKREFHSLNEKGTILKIKEENVDIHYCFKIANSSYMACLRDQIVQLGNLSQIQNRYYTFKIDGYYREGIVININIFAFTSNKIISGGEDTIIFYNFMTEKIFKEIKNYSFILSSTGLCLMQKENSDTPEALLCACKRYVKGQKNGILLIGGLDSIEKSNYNKNNIQFYNTRNFGVHCFCQLSIKENDNIVFNVKRKKTYYFLVGGFDIKKNKGLIKLFKICKKEKDKIFAMEEVYDFSLEEDNKFKRFDGAISCIEQTKNKLNILVSCWNGKVYLFDVPNLDQILSWKSKLKSMLLCKN